MKRKICMYPNAHSWKKLLVTFQLYEFLVLQAFDGYLETIRKKNFGLLGR